MILVPIALAAVNLMTLWDGTPRPKLNYFSLAMTGVLTLMLITTGRVWPWSP